MCEGAQKSFYAFYQTKSRAQTLKDINHIITYLNDHLELWETQEDGSLYRVASVKTPAGEEEYCFYKTFSHLSVILYNIIESIINYGTMSKEDEDTLQEEKRRLYLFLMTSHPIIERNQEDIRKFLFFIEEILHCTDKAKAFSLLTCYSEKIASINDRYPRLAAEVQLSGMHSIVSNWLEEKALNLFKTTVLFAVAASPREGLIEGQYFFRLYREYGMTKPEENRRLFFFEMLPQQIAETTSTCLIEALKQRDFNEKIGKEMLGDANAMKKDILAPYALPMLNQLFSNSSRMRCPYSKATQFLESLTFPSPKKIETFPASTRSSFFTKTPTKYSEIKKSLWNSERPFPRFY